MKQVISQGIPKTFFEAPKWRRREAGEPARADAEGSWITSLHLVTPRLGEISARLGLTPQGVRITLDTPIDASAADLRGAAPILEKSMAAAGVPLLALQVKHGSPG